MGSFIKEIATAIPGIDEAMSFAEVMKFVGSLNCTMPSISLSQIQARSKHEI
jgi:hypothetical protein